MPGEVIEGHAEVEHKCESCHGSDSEEQKNLCLDCHEEVKYDIKEGEGLHGRISKLSIPQCAICHSEHIGRIGDIVNLNKDMFDHDKTDFHLEGRHLALPCSSCHLETKKFRDAPKDCFSCHETDDFHGGSLGESCQDCHTPEDWVGRKFDHDQTEFALMARHQDVQCNACHADNKYLDTPQECYACHAINDVHEGVNGEQCESCHDEEGWDQINFDHDVDTQFALGGSHKNTRCDACHEQTTLEENLGTDCVDCHRKDDEHGGQNGDECNICHSEDRWGLIGFDHSLTEFTLTGKHDTASCESCHRGGTSPKIGMACVDCHQPDDVHAGDQGAACEACHSPKGWLAEVRFSHDMTGFPLVGIHAITSCDACHFSRAFSSVESGCIDCHTRDDIHDGALGSNCHSCHNPNNWRLWIFDHAAQTDFVLDGEHEGLACSECHFKPTQSVVKQSSQCVSCHVKDDVHSKSFGSACDRCHQTSSFKNARVK